MKKKEIHIQLLERALRIHRNFFVLIFILFFAGLLFLGLFIKVNDVSTALVKSASFSLSNPYSLKSNLVLSLVFVQGAQVSPEDVSSVLVEIEGSEYVCANVQLKQGSLAVVATCTVVYHGKSFTSFVYKATNAKGDVTFLGLEKVNDPRKISLVLVKAGDTTTPSLFLGVKSLYFLNRCSLISADSMKTVTQMVGTPASNPLIPLSSLGVNGKGDVFARCYIGSSYVDTDPVSIESLL